MSTKSLATKIISGNTIMMVTQFRNWHNEVIQVSNLRLKVYDMDDEVLFDEDITNDVEEQDVGTYYYKYTTPLNKDAIIVEISTTYNEKPLIIRKVVKLIKSRI